VVDDGVIPAAFTRVEHSGGSTVIRSLNAPGGLWLRGGTLRLTAGPSRVGGRFELAEGATLEGAGPTVSLVVDGEPTEWMGEVRAEGGALMRLVSLVRVRGGGLDWFADGPGTLIEAPGVTNVSLTPSAGFPIRVRNEARIVLSGLETVRGPLQLDARDGGELDLSGARGLWTCVGFSQNGTLSALAGGRIRIPGITALEDVNVWMDSANGVETAQWESSKSGQWNVEGAEWDLGSVTNVTAMDIRVRDGGVVRLPKLTQIRGESSYWFVDGQDSLIEARALVEVALNTPASFLIQARNQGQVVLPGLTSLRGAVQLDAREGAEIMLAGVSGRWSSLGSSQRGALTALEGGRVRMGALTALDRISIETDSTDGIATSAWTSLTDGQLVVSGAEPDFRALTNITAADIRLSDGAVVRLPGVPSIRGESVYWLVDGPGTLLDGSAITNLSFNTSASFLVQARNEGRVALTGLAGVRGALVADARTGGEVDLSQLRGRWTSVGSSQRGGVVALEEGRVRMGGIRELDGIHLTLDSIDGVDTSAWTSVTDSQLVLTDGEWVLGSVTNVNGSDLRLSDGAVLRLPAVRQIRGDSPYWLADGPGVVLDARWVSQVSLNSGAGFLIQTRNQARVDLSGIQELAGGLQPDARGGSVIDFSGAMGVWKRGPSATVPQIYAASEGRILTPNLTGFEDGTLTISGAGFVDTTLWERVVECTVTADGVDAVLAFGSLRDQTGTTFRVLNGGRIVYAAAPRLKAGPQGRAVSVGETVVLSVDADGDAPLRYQWYKNGQPLAGEVDALLRLENFRVEDAGAYQVFVGNSAGLIASDPAVLSVRVDPLPFDDDFARRGLISSHSGTGSGNNRNASAETGEPRHADKTGGRSIWLTWRAPVSGVASIRTTGSSFDTLLAVYRGRVLADLNANRVAADEDGGGFLTSEVTFNAEAGIEYQIAVDGYAGAQGDVIVTWTLVELSAASPNLPDFTREPSNAVTVVGGSVTLSVEVQDRDVLFQWLKNGVPLPGETSAVLRLNGIQPSDAGLYQAVARTPAGGARTSSPGRVEVVDRPEDASGFSADKVEDLFVEEELGGGARSLMAQAGAGGSGIGIGLPGGRWTDNRGSTRSPSDPVVCDVETTATRWFRLRLNVPAVQAFTLHTEGSEVPAFLAVFTNRSALKLVGCDAAAIPQKPAARVVFPARSGVDYLVLVDGVAGAQGRIHLNWALEDSEVPVRRPEMNLEAGRLVIDLFPLPGTYDWQTGERLGALQTLFRTNLAVGQFRFIDPQPASAASRFYFLKPVRP